MPTWPTKSKRPLRRATFGHAAIYDLWLDAHRRETRASMLGAIDWMLHRHQACPWRPSSPAAKAYRAGYERERQADPTPDYPPIPDLPRARGPYVQRPDEKEA